MSNAPGSSYDEVPYVDTCHGATHPDRLATLAAVYGLPAPPVERCRVLELGCARGGNLLPMALELPEASFVGVDLSTRQVAEAREAAEALGLRNVAFHAMGLEEIDAAFGTFDFVVCHGVYSWVPEPVRERILAICATNLSPDGLAYVSYNTYPGWSSRGMVRDLVRFHVREEETPEGRVERARGFLEELAGHVVRQEGAYASVLKVEASRFREADDTYLLHEFFEDDNAPCFVHEFLRRAAAAGLEFVAEAQAPGLFASLPEAARELVVRWAGDVAAREQYLDLMVNRTFRRSVLRRAGGLRAAAPSPEAVERLAARAVVVPAPVAGEAEGKDGPIEFVHPGRGGSIRTNDPALKAALLALYEVRPAALPFGTLWEHVHESLSRSADSSPRPATETREALRSSLLRLFLADFLDLHVRPPRPAAEPAERPVGSPLARRQAASGSTVTSLLRRRVELDELARAVLLELDGTRDEEEVLAAVVARVCSGALELSDASGPVREEGVARALLAGEIRPAIGRIARLALLVG
ncbi:MAG: class I SAM-dependent methyltransferase [Thermoanaerobaculia bacterium]|jgi:SAM-dependent methyltransferase|nr:class I SAM-dependent methyltransferase [Thermoanaerobaculia bacterium]